MSDLASALPWDGNEAELVTELQAGSEEAFDCLVTQYHAAVHSLAFRMLGDAGDAADVAQEVFLKAFRGLRSFRRGSSLRTWLYRITVREALNQRRWWWRHLRGQTSMDATAERNASALALAAGDATPFELLATREVQGLVRQGLRQLLEPFRSAVILRDLEGLSYEEVAEVLEVSVGTVKSRILRGRRALREILTPVLEDSAKATRTAVRPETVFRESALAKNLPARPRTAGRLDPGISLRGFAGGGGE